MKIALLQILPAGGEEENRKKGEEYCRRAKAAGADIALFPEMWSCGYRLPADPERIRKLGVSYGGMFVRSFARLARELQMAVGITFLENSALLPKNSFCLYDRFGREVLHYSKVHTCDFDVERYLTPGDDFSVCDLDTAEGTVKVGAMICYDREFPESARILMLKGAEVILVPNACPLEINRLSALRTRAYENMLAVAACNYPAGQPDCNGHSAVFDGVAWLRGEACARDMCVLEAPEGEGAYVAEIDLGMLRRYRRSEAMGNAYRRPDRYGQLLSQKVEAPFLRADKRG